MEHLFIYTNSCLLSSFVPLLCSLSEPSQTDSSMLIVLEVQFYDLGEKKQVISTSVSPQLTKIHTLMSAGGKKGERFK